MIKRIFVYSFLFLIFSCGPDEEKSNHNKLKISEKYSKEWLVKVNKKWDDICCFLKLFLPTIFLVSGVSTNPGDTEFTKILYFAKTRDEALVNPNKADFEVEYIARFSLLTTPNIDEIFIILPFFFLIIIFEISFVNNIGPLTLTF